MATALFIIVSIIASVAMAGTEKKELYPCYEVAVLLQKNLTQEPIQTIDHVMTACRWNVESVACAEEQLERAKALEAERRRIFGLIERCKELTRSDR